MKILLVNDNPVVTKLVTLSAQKTNDDVEVAHSFDEVGGGEYDLIVIDDALYSDDFFDKIKDKLSYKKSLLICSRDTEPSEEFTSVLKKPFLPTDLVELFTMIDSKLESAPQEVEIPEELEELDDLDDFDDFDPEEDDFFLDDLDNEDDQGLSESVLDNEEAQKVKDLLDEDYEMALDLEDEVDVDISVDEEAEKIEDESFEDDLEDITFDDEVALDKEEFELDEIESEIENTVADLDEDELESEVDEKTLLDIANSEIDAFDELSSKDLKLALGEEVNEEEAQKEVEVDSVEEVQSDSEHNSNGVESLKKLLEILNDKEVAASLKGSKITINISLGDE